MFGRLRTYASELAFATKTGCDLRSRLLLAVKTIQFHWHNRRKVAPQPGGEFEIKARLGHSDVPLTLRPYAGHLFTFYEILFQEYYSLPKSLCDPHRVRTILDCGANIGLASLYFAERYPEARILALEPHPENFRLLRANTRLQQRITPIQACVAGSLHKPRFISLGKPAWGNQTNETGEGVQVPAATIDSICREYEVDFIDILKVNIEGGEEEVFADAAFLSRVGLVVIELHDRYDLDCFQRDVAKWGFTANAPDPRVGTKVTTATPRIPHIGTLSPRSGAIAGTPW